MRRLIVRLALGLTAALMVGGCSSFIPDTVEPPINATPGVSVVDEACWWASETPAETTPSTVAGEPLHKPNETVELGPLRVTLTGVFCPRGAGDFGPAVGEQFVVLEYTVANHGDEPRTVSSTFEARLRDSAGVEYRPDVMANQLAGLQLAGVLEPGDQRSGRAGFRVPASEERLIFVFDSHPFGPEGRIYIALQ